VFVVVDRRFVGTDNAGRGSRVLSVQATGPGAFSITYARYERGDPDCCPTGPPATVTYAWDGSRLNTTNRP